jgi:hypothetical protein
MRLRDADSAAGGVQIEERSAAVDRYAELAPVTVVRVRRRKIRGHASAAGGCVEIYMSV